MSELLSQLWVPELQILFVVLVIMLLALYVLSVIWVIRDAYHRGVTWYVWGLVALIPIVGVIAYCLLRPPLLQIDRDEQELEVALKQRELMKYGECANCGYPVESDYVMCPNCHQRLKNLCPTCHHALSPSWSVCPYCTTPIGGQGVSSRAHRQAPTAQARSGMPHRADMTADSLRQRPASARADQSDTTTGMAE